MGLTHVTVTVRNIRDPGRVYSALFYVDTGASDSLIPAEGAEALGVEPVGVAECELANERPEKFPFAICQIEFMGDITGGRVLFGPSGVEPILGVTALESVGITVDRRTETVRRLPALERQLIAVNARHRLVTAGGALTGLLFKETPLELRIVEVTGPGEVEVTARRSSPFEKARPELSRRGD